MANIVDEKNLKLKTFTIRERDPKVIRHAKKAIFTTKHLENIINILLKNEYELIKSKTNEKAVEEENKNWEIFNLLTNSVIMKAVLSNNTGGEKTKNNIKKINDYYQNNQLLQNAKLLHKDLNDKNISELIKEIKKNWQNYF